MKFIATLIALFFASAAYADKVQIVNPGSEEGVFRQILTTIGENIEHDFVQANNPVTAYSYIVDGTDPKLTVWSSEWPGDSDIKSPAVTQENIVALITTETLICSREFNSLDEMAGQQIKIATWGSEPVARFLNNLGSNIGADFIVVPFDGSGSTTKGYIAGDADTVFTITTRQTALEEDAKTNCFAFSANGDLGFRFVDAIITVDAEQALTDKLRELLALLRQKPEWQNKFSGTSTYVGGTDEVVEIFDQAVENFSK